MSDLYRHYNKDGILLYVGVSLRTLNRLQQHKDGSHWFGDIAKVTIDKLQDRASALAAEREAILKENPLHNIRRPSIKEVKRALASRMASESKADLVSRIVQFNPLYSLREAAVVLGVGVDSIHGLISKHKIGFVIIGNRKKITGWHLIDFIEQLSNDG